MDIICYGQSVTFTTLRRAVWCMTAADRLHTRAVLSLLFKKIAGIAPTVFLCEMFGRRFARDRPRESSPWV
jgi:hypothetical protein